MTKPLKRRSERDIHNSRARFARAKAFRVPGFQVRYAKRVSRQTTLRKDALHCWPEIILGKPCLRLVKNLAVDADREMWVDPEHRVKVVELENLTSSDSAKELVLGEESYFPGIRKEIHLRRYARVLAQKHLGRRDYGELLIP